MAEYTPSTEDIRDAWREQHDISWEYADRLFAEFDRWLEAVRNAARAEGWVAGWTRGRTMIGRITTDHCWLGAHRRCGGQVNTPTPHGCECPCHEPHDYEEADRG